MATSIDYIAHTCQSGLAKDQLQRAANIFLDEGTAFAVAQGLLWMSESSWKVFCQHRESILSREG